MASGAPYGEFHPVKTNPLPGSHHIEGLLVYWRFKKDFWTHHKDKFWTRAYIFPIYKAGLWRMAPVFAYPTQGLVVEPLEVDIRIVPELIELG